MKAFLSFISIFVLLFSGCEQQTPSQVTDEPTYIQLIAELQLSKGYLQVTKDSIGHVALKNEIFKKYGLTKEQYEFSHAWYEKDYEKQLQRYKRARAYIEFLENGPLKEQSPVLSPRSDSLFK